MAESQRGRREEYGELPGTDKAEEKEKNEHHFPINLR
jgi:hypothetical protein